MKFSLTEICVRSPSMRGAFAVCFKIDPREIGRVTNWISVKIWIYLEMTNSAAMYALVLAKSKTSCVY